MHTSELLKHIYDINLSYLLLAQRLIVQDKASAMFRLGINEEMATTLAALTLPQMQIYLYHGGHPDPSGGGGLFPAGRK